jgi:hypothetical protein
VNLPQYRRAVGVAHDEFAKRMSAAQEAYHMAMTGAGEQLREDLSRIDQEFHEDPEIAKAAYADAVPREARRS